MLTTCWCEYATRGRDLFLASTAAGLGIGIPLMASVADDFRISNRDGTAGTLVALRFSL